MKRNRTIAMVLAVILTVSLFSSCGNRDQPSEDHQHVFKNWTIDKEPTCIEPGIRHFICLKCGETVTNEFPALGHSFEDGKCVRCGIKISADDNLFSDMETEETNTSIESGSEETDLNEKKHSFGPLGLEYYEQDDGTWEVAGIGLCEDLNIIIPSTFNGQFVTSIGDYAFDLCDSLTDITIPESVNSIGDFAFNHCGNLKSIEIPDSVTSIGKGAFRFCSELIRVMIPNGVTIISDNAFEGCDNLTEITIPNSVTSIGSYTFDGCQRLHDIMIPNNVISIGEGAFKDCGLYTISIPDSVTSIGEGAFKGCSLQTITIPNGVSTIEKCLFEGCSSLTSITIPNSVTIIGDHAFEGCSRLTRIAIPESVTRIGNSVLSVTIERITFNGTVAQWKEISKALSWDVLTYDYVVICSDGNLSKNES